MDDYRLLIHVQGHSKCVFEKEYFCWKKDTKHCRKPTPPPHYNWNQAVAFAEASASASGNGATASASASASAKSHRMRRNVVDVDPPQLPGVNDVEQKLQGGVETTGSDLTKAVDGAGVPDPSELNLSGPQGTVDKTVSGFEGKVSGATDELKSKVPVDLSNPAGDVSGPTDELKSVLPDTNSLPDFSGEVNKGTDDLTGFTGDAVQGLM